MLFLLTCLGRFLVLDFGFDPMHQFVDSNGWAKPTMVLQKLVTGYNFSYTKSFENYEVKQISTILSHVYNLEK